MVDNPSMRIRPTLELQWITDLLEFLSHSPTLPPTLQSLQKKLSVELFKAQQGAIQGVPDRIKPYNLEQKLGFEPKPAALSSDEIANFHLSFHQESQDRDFILTVPPEQRRASTVIINNKYHWFLDSPYIYTSKKGYDSIEKLKQTATEYFGLTILESD